MLELVEQPVHCASRDVNSKRGQGSPKVVQAHTARLLLVPRAQDRDELLAVLLEHLPPARKGHGDDPSSQSLDGLGAFVEIYDPLAPF